ncbi:MAG: pectate lyase, partial [Planctomycetes bacterium]|nr:pectate lyase [Planctomycetota bacterium]
MSVYRAGWLWVIAIGLVVGQTGAQEKPGHVSWKACSRQKAEWYSGREAVRIGDNVLLYQRASGGWLKNTDLAAPLSDSQKANLAKAKSRTDSTIDNGATITPLRYLARLYNATKQQRFKTAFLKGLDYLFDAQYENGGWPQFYPNARGYSTHITFNDGAMINVMTLFCEVRDKKSEFAFVDEQRRAKTKRAVEKGIECILKCQIVLDGKRLAWCAQHDEKTFAPRPARSYERASLSGAESVGIVRFLMSIEKPTPAIIAAVEGAVVWFEQAKVTGIRQTSKRAPGTEKGYDKVVVADADAPPIWGRFNQIGTNRAIFCSRDGVIRYSLAEISYERRNGYSWYTSA